MTKFKINTAMQCSKCENELFKIHNPYTLTCSKCGHLINFKDVTFLESLQEMWN